ncbi:transcriptional regulator [Streptomyces sp. NRRL F-4489]|uniref:SRPBCC family protein n=1 Tax=Streptomyces sp. NRRL F-4489 TaxID=1609095 RepID=UPI000748154D|nr:SRPBCC family protein [Streptomyces sp. NRRL F-4489]KUL45965.1 transcriptional regulator [Streptomyces sp. NRRL F-4489]
MDGNAFVYTVYIETTPEKLWQGLTDPAFTRRYWGAEFTTDWAVGSAMTWEERGAKVADPAQIVLESEPCRRLSYPWHTFTREWAKAVGVDEGTRAEIAAERRSKVAFEIEALGEVVRLTVVHDGFEPGSTVREMIRHGWPAIVSSLKTLLETGQALPEAEPAG